MCRYFLNFKRIKVFFFFFLCFFLFFLNIQLTIRFLFCYRYYLKHSLMGSRSVFHLILRELKSMKSDFTLLEMHLMDFVEVTRLFSLKPRILVKGKKWLLVMQEGLDLTLLFLILMELQSRLSFWS